MQNSDICMSWDDKLGFEGFFAGMLFFSFPPFFELSPVELEHRQDKVAIGIGHLVLCEL